MLSLPRSGSNWVRYWFEYFSNEKCSEKNILVPVNADGNRTEDQPSTLYKRHAITLADLKDRDVKNLLLIVRDYKETFKRHARRKLKNMDSFIENIKTFDQFKGNKLVIYYEDFIPDFNYIAQALDFLGVQGNYKNLDVEKHREISIKLYDDACSSATKDDLMNFKFHQNSISDKEKEAVTLYLKEHLGDLFDSYLRRY
jgi:hypothetical protein